MPTWCKVIAAATPSLKRMDRRLWVPAFARTTIECGARRSDAAFVQLRSTTSGYFCPRSVLAGPAATRARPADVLPKTRLLPNEVMVPPPLNPVVLYTTELFAIVAEPLI